MVRMRRVALQGMRARLPELMRAKAQSGGDDTRRPQSHAASSAVEMCESWFVYSVQPQSLQNIPRLAVRLARDA